MTHDPAENPDAEAFVAALNDIAPVKSDDIFNACAYLIGSVFHVAPASYRESLREKLSVAFPEVWDMLTQATERDTSH